MKNTAAQRIDDNSYPKTKIVDLCLQSEHPSFSFYQARKNWTPDDWKKHLRTQRSRWKVLPKAILNCDAYWELSNAAKVIVSRALGELKFKQSKVKNSRKGNSLLGRIDEPHDFCLPYGMLMAAGIGTKPTISKALKELKASGWIVQVNHSSPFGLSVYRLGPDVLNEKILKRPPKVSLK